MSLLSSRRRPWPYHMRMGSILGTPVDRLGLMLLAQDSGGLLVGKKQQMLDGVIPSTQEYGSSPVYRERTWAFPPTGGYGERVQSTWADHRYYWGMDIQVSGGLFGKGPLFHPITPAGASGLVLKFWDAPQASGNPPPRDLLINSGSKTYKRADDTNAGQQVQKDFSPDAPMDAVVFKGGFAGATASSYVTTSGGALWERTPANVWTQCSLPAGMNANAVEVLGTELWIGDTQASVVRKCTSDPKVAGSWSGPFFVGDPSSWLTTIRACGGTLVILKGDGGIFTLNSDGSTNDLFPGTTVPHDRELARRTQAWLGSLWIPTPTTLYRLDMPGAQLEAVGPGKILENDSPVRGEARVFCGWSGYQGYLCIWNAQDNISYLLSYGNWEPRASEEGTTYVFDDQFDGALAHWPGKKVSAMNVSGAAGDRLYIGFDDGTWTWMKLVRNPLAVGSGAEFSLGPSELVFPLHHAMFQADLKHWLGFSVFGPVIRVGDEATLYYRIMASAGSPPTDPSGNWLLLGEFTQNGQRIPAPENLAGNALSLKIALANSDTTNTPVIEVVGIHERVVPAFKRDFSGTVDGRWVTTRLDGAAYRPNSEQVHKYMMDAAALPGSVALELPDETVNEVAVFDYSERLLPMQAGGGHSWLIDFQATQFRVLTIYGIIGRLRGTRIGDLRGYQIGSLHYL